VRDWTINPLFTRCGKIDFRGKASARDAVETWSSCCRESAQVNESAISGTKPFVIVKPKRYLRDGNILCETFRGDGAYRKQRNKMAVVKKASRSAKVIIPGGRPS